MDSSEDNFDDYAVKEIMDVVETAGVKHCFGCKKRLTKKDYVPSVSGNIPSTSIVCWCPAGSLQQSDSMPFVQSKSDRSKRAILCALRRIPLVVSWWVWPGILENEFKTPEPIRYWFGIEKISRSLVQKSCLSVVLGCYITPKSDRPCWLPLSSAAREVRR